MELPALYLTAGGLDPLADDTLRLDGANAPSAERIPLDGGPSVELAPEGDATAFAAEYEIVASERLRVSRARTGGFGSTGATGPGC